MIRRSVKKNLRAVYWAPPQAALTPPVVFCSTHFGWFDGYIIYLAVKELRIWTLDWIAEYERFPMFGSIGGLPMPKDDPTRRASTIRRTIRLMREKRASLVVFADGVLRYPHEEWHLGKSCELIAKQVPEALFVPTAIRYETTMHERPQCFLSMGEPIPFSGLREMEQQIKLQWDRIEENLYERKEFQLLSDGTKSAHEMSPGRRAS